MTLSLVFVLYAAFMQAQVNVGANEDALPGAIMQWKQTTGVTTGAQNATGGLAFPRVALTDVDQLFPMFSSNPDTYATNKSTLDPQYTGLVVYNVTNDASKGLSPGLAQWDGSKWIPLSQAGGTGSAIFAVVSCQDITVNGGYVVNTPTNSQNYLTVNLNVTTPGSYSIMAQTGNGYSFYLSGMALNAGPLTVTVPAQGTPTSASDPATKVDTLAISGIPIAADCKKTIIVDETIAGYSLNCTATTFNGSYVKGTPLTATNTLTLGVSVSAAPGTYYISTPVTNGISFSGKGTLSTTGIQMVTLTGSGTPTAIGDFPITINANTQQGTATCSATVPVIAPAMTYAIIGSGDYNWAGTARLAALHSAANFGPNGTVKINSFTQLWSTTDRTQATGYLTSGFPNPPTGSTSYPDVILYFAYGTEPDYLPLARALAGYVTKGGCLVYGGAADDWPSTVIPAVDTLLVNMFGAFGPTGSTTSVAVAQIAGTTVSTDDDYPINNLPNDPIINGPFGNLAGGYWGEDNGSTGDLILPVLPPLSVQICSASNADGKANVPSAYSMVWYNTYLSFVYFGDCVGASSNTSEAGDTSSYPAYYPGAVPTSKQYGPGSTYNHAVNNSQLEMNAVAWAIQRALTNGINPH